ncbi:MAG: hypothetical protein RL240_2190 [Planctomycetota bacterium]|jgi:hypothetical protein
MDSQQIDLPNSQGSWEEELLACLRLRSRTFATVALLAWGSILVLGMTREAESQTDMMQGAKLIDGPWTIDINQATAEDLQLIPSLGPNLIRAILSKRSEIGGFTDWDQLRSIPGIKEGRIRILSEYLSLQKSLNDESPAEEHSGSGQTAPEHRIHD